MGEAVRASAILLLAGELIPLADLCNKLEKGAEAGNNKFMYMKFRPFMTRRQKLLQEQFQCEWCGVTSTPEMRPGPGGKNALCNRYTTNRV